MTAPGPLLRDRRPLGPAGARLYAVGDVHGRLDLLEAIFALIDADIARHPERTPVQILIGDLIDRGPSSAGVIDWAIRRQAERGLTVLRGNHEQYILDTLREPGTLDRWLQFGGVEALASYKIDPGTRQAPRTNEAIASDFANTLPEAHRRFIESLPHWVRHGDFLFVHAGIRPGIALDRQSPHDLRMIRDGFLDDDRDHGFVVVHGHTPVREPEIRRNRIDIDTKAWESGRLTCLVIDGEALHFLSTGG